MNTDSVEKFFHHFLEELLLPRSYFRFQENDSFESLVKQFPQIIPMGIFMVGPYYFDPGNPAKLPIPVFILDSVNPYLVPFLFS